MFVPPGDFAAAYALQVLDADKGSLESLPDIPESALDRLAAETSLSVEQIERWIVRRLVALDVAPSGDNTTFPDNSASSEARARRIPGLLVHSERRPFHPFQGEDPVSLRAEVGDDKACTTTLQVSFRANVPLRVCLRQQAADESAGGDGDDGLLEPDQEEEEEGRAPAIDIREFVQRGSEARKAEWVVRQPVLFYLPNPGAVHECCRRKLHACASRRC